MLGSEAPRSGGLPANQGLRLSRQEMTKLDTSRSVLMATASRHWVSLCCHFCGEEPQGDGPRGVSGADRPPVSPVRRAAQVKLPADSYSLLLGLVLLAPVLPRMQAHFAEVPGSAVLVPVVLTLPALVIALLAPFAGIIADRLGRKPLLLASMLLYVLCGVLPLWLESLPAIVLSRAGIGLAEAAIMTCCTTLMGDYYNGARRERLFALQMVATSLSAAIFIAVGGMLGEHGWRTPFALYGIGLLFLPLMAWFLWEPRGQVAATAERQHRRQCHVQHAGSVHLPAGRKRLLRDARVPGLGDLQAKRSGQPAGNA